MSGISIESRCGNERKSERKSERKVRTVMPIVRICGPKDRPVGRGIKMINCCSISKNWSSGLSPFFCGPCELPSGEISKNVENACQIKRYK